MQYLRERNLSVLIMVIFVHQSLQLSLFRIYLVLLQEFSQLACVNSESYSRKRHFSFALDIQRIECIISVE